EACDGCVAYSRFRAEDSPIPDLVHAIGQVLADKDSDALLLALMDLLENHEDVVARLLGAALKVKDIADQHDVAAAQGMEPLASLPYEAPIWDQVAQIVARITAHPGLMTKLVGVLANDTMITPSGGSKHVGDMLARFMTNRDRMTYDPNNVNGPAINAT